MLKFASFHTYVLKNLLLRQYYEQASEHCPSLGNWDVRQQRSSLIGGFKDLRYLNCLWVYCIPRNFVDTFTRVTEKFQLISVLTSSLGTNPGCFIATSPTAVGSSKVSTGVIRGRLESQGRTLQCFILEIKPKFWSVYYIKDMGI